jgi:hypothetical protein
MINSGKITLDYLSNLEWKQCDCGNYEARDGNFAYTLISFYEKTGLLFFRKDVEKIYFEITSLEIPEANYLIRDYENEKVVDLLDSVRNSIDTIINNRVSEIQNLLDL